MLFAVWMRAFTDFDCTVYVVAELFCVRWFIFFFKQKTAYEMRISDWSSDVCSSDLDRSRLAIPALRHVVLNPGGLQRVEIAIGPGQALDGGDRPARGQLGRASCRERVCQYV